MLPLTPLLFIVSSFVLSPASCAVFASNGAELNGYGHKLAHQRGIPHEHVRPIPHLHLPHPHHDHGHHVPSPVPAPVHDARLPPPVLPEADYPYY